MNKEKKNRRGLKILLTVVLIIVLALLLLKFCSPNNVDPTPVEPDPPIVDPTPIEDKEYTVSFIDMNGNVLKTQTLKEGETPFFTDTVQSIVSGDYVYSFKSWDKELSPVTCDIQYKGVYTKYYIGTVKTPSYFYIENTGASNGEVSLKNRNNFTGAIYLDYLLEGSTEWKPFIQGSGDSIAVTLSPNQKMYFKAGKNNGALGNYDASPITDKYYRFNLNNSTTYSAGGDIMCLLNENAEVSNFASSTYKSCFYALFYGCDALTDASKLLLPATSLSESCYCYMFGGCTNLEKVPALPATKLATNCYGYMFNGCETLDETPMLPANKLAKECYQFMFNQCYVLTTPPALPATSLAEKCYFCMFMECYALATAPELPATNLAESCYSFMFSSCVAIVDAPELPAMIMQTDCYKDMFEFCEGIVTAPELPSTTLADGCYALMFAGCTSLENTPVLPATELKPRCYQEIFGYCNNITSITVYFDESQFTPNPPENSLNSWIANISKTDVEVYWKGTDSTHFKPFLLYSWTLTHID